MNIIPFCLPLINDNVESEVLSCLNETGWLTSGPKVKKLEDEISNLCKTGSTICVNSWTSGMLLIIKWLGLDENDEIIVPAYTYAASALSVINSNVKCVFVDVNDDFTINIDEVEKAITTKTKAIMPVDLGGLPADYKALKKLLNKDNIKKKFIPKSDFQKKIGRPIILSDAAHSIGSLIDGIPTPLFSDFSVFSFHSVKNITTGEGGAITFKIFNKEKDNEILNELKLLSLNGQNKTAFQKSTIGGWKYDITTNGLKVNMPDINAAIGLAQIKKYKHVLLPERERIFLKYHSILSKYSWAILPNLILDNRRSSCHLYQLRIKGFDENKRDELIRNLSSLKIGVNVHYIPLPMLSYFKTIGLNIKDFQNSYNLYKNEISLPIYNNLSLENVEYICQNIIEIVESITKEINN
ncbi:MAG: DegT/DnrJ/EryC1/StrS family aminotransferase [Flavobacteriaceae bacterium]|nr:DegT/DnrJ/EryC1/StrS family aminotransferase [Flavobacteriaceae bacterium]